MPWAVIGGMIAYRKSWLRRGRGHHVPRYLDSYREVGKKLKAKGHPFGQTLGHTFGDAPGFTYPYMWSWGGKEVEADGKTVVINSKETVESVSSCKACGRTPWTKAALPGTTPTTTEPSCRKPSRRR